MIVIGINAILALIALPGVPDKLIRDRIVESLKLTDIVKAPVAATWARVAMMPLDNVGAGLPVADKIVNDYISSVAVESGAIQVTFGNHANVAVQGKVLTLRPAVVEDAPVVPVTRLRQCPGGAADDRGGSQDDGASAICRCRAGPR